MKITMIEKYRSKNIKSFIKLTPSSLLKSLVYDTNNFEFRKCCKTATWQVYSRKNLVHARYSKVSLVDYNIAGF